MSTPAIDYSNARFDPSVLRAAGVTTVFRYLAHPSWPKALSAAEAHGLLAAGISIALNYETSATRASQGVDAGRSDAQAANAYADAIGAPQDTVIFYSVDAPLSFAQVSPYFLGAKSAGRRPVGIYGPLPVEHGLETAGLVVATWVTNAASWSGYRTWDALATAARGSSAVALQHIDHPIGAIAAQSYDYDEVLKPFPRWGYTPPAPKVAPMYSPGLGTNAGGIAAVWEVDAVVNGVTRKVVLAAVADNGDVYAWGVPRRTWSTQKTDFAGRHAATIGQAKGLPFGRYTITATSGETYTP